MGTPCARCPQCHLATFMGPHQHWCCRCRPFTPAATGVVAVTVVHGRLQLWVLSPSLSSVCTCSFGIVASLLCCWLQPQMQLLSLALVKWRWWSSGGDSESRHQGGGGGNKRGGVEPSLPVRIESARKAVALGKLV